MKLRLTGVATYISAKNDLNQMKSFFEAKLFLFERCLSIWVFGCFCILVHIVGVAGGTSKNMWFCVVVCVLCVFRVVVVVLVGVPFL